MDVKSTNETLVNFWDKVYTVSDEEKQGATAEEDLKQICPSEKLFNGAKSLGACKKVLDYGCGDAWASIVAAMNGCDDVTAVDVAAAAADLAAFQVELYKLQDKIKTACVAPDYLHSIADGTFDGVFCSNVLDVVPPETSRDIISEFARITAKGATLVIGMNYHATRENDKDLTDEGFVFVDGVLRMVSRSDEEWSEIFSEFFTVEKLDHFAWPMEEKETRRLFILKKD